MRTRGRDAMRAGDNGDELFKWGEDICRNFHKGEPNSEEANLATAKARDSARIMSVLGEGMSCDEAEVKTGISHQTCSARFSDMKRVKAIEAVVDGEGRRVRRLTRHGCWATVYRKVQ